MQLGVGLCYRVLLANGQVVSFRFTGQDAAGNVIAESPPGSGQTVNLLQLIGGGYTAYWQIDCP